MTVSFEFSPVAFRLEMDKLREKGVAVDNAQSETARHALGGLVADKVTPEGVTIIALAAYGDPKTPKGKPATTLSGLRYAKGGDSARKALASVFAIFKLRNVEGAADLINAYVDKEKGAAKGVFALETAVKALAKAALGEAAETGEGEGEGEGKGDETSPADMLRDQLGAITDAIVAAATSDLVAVEGRIAALFDALTVASDRIADKAHRDEVAAIVAAA